MSITKKQADKVVQQVTYFRNGAESFRRQVIKLVNKLSKEYDKSIDIDHFKKELKLLNVSIINTDR